MNQELSDGPATGEDLVWIEACVQRQLRGRVRGFRLLLRDGGLILQGITNTYYSKQLAQHAIMQAVDLRILANDIEVA